MAGRRPVESDLELDWAQVASLIRGILTHDDESTFPVEGGRFNDDANFRPAKQAAVGLLEELVREHAALIVPDEAMSQFAEMLVTLADDKQPRISTSHTTRKAAWIRSLSPYLNWQWPENTGTRTHLPDVSRQRHQLVRGCALSPSERELGGLIRVAHGGQSWERDWQGSC